MFIDGLRLFLVEGTDLAGALKRIRLVWARDATAAENRFRREFDAYKFPSVTAYEALSTEDLCVYAPDDK